MPPSSAYGSSAGFRGVGIEKQLRLRLTDADYVWHVDSDCVFRRPASRAILSGSHREVFTWVDLTTEPLTDPLCRVFWSHAGLDSASRAEIAQLLA